MPTATTTPLRVLVADDHQIVREGVRRLIETEPGWKVVAEASNGREAVAAAIEHKPDVAVLDIGMPGLNGLDATRQIRRESPKTEILIFTGTETEEMVLSLFEAGARSYVLKSESRDQLIQALRSLAQHKPYFTSHIGEIVFARLLGKSGPAAELPERGRLTAREREIVQLLGEGSSNKEVAETLGVSIKTVETHRAAIMRKLKLESFSDLVRYAVRNHIIEA